MKFSFILFAFASITFFSCGDDVDCDANNFVSSVNAEISALNDAGQTWANDPSTDNCNKWKDAAQDYLKAVEDFEGCDGLDQSQFQDALQQSRDAVNSITCN